MALARHRRTRVVVVDADFGFAESRFALLGLENPGLSMRRVVFIRPMSSRGKALVKDGDGGESSLAPKLPKTARKIQSIPLKITTVDFSVGEETVDFPYVLLDSPAGIEMGFQGMRSLLLLKQ
jgi:septum formation inhibitor-activating ATPase MinD